MKKLMKYETPDLEVTKFHIGDSIMDYGGDGDGDIVTDFYGPSTPESPTRPPIDFDQKGVYDMKRNIRKMIAAVSAIVMVVSSITVINTSGADLERCV